MSKALVTTKKKKAKGSSNVKVPFGRASLTRRAEKKRKKLFIYKGRKNVLVYIGINNLWWCEKSGGNEVGVAKFNKVYKGMKDERKGRINLSAKTGEVKIKCEDASPGKKKMTVKNMKQDREIVLELDGHVADEWLAIMRSQLRPRERKDAVQGALKDKRERAIMALKNAERIKSEVELRKSERNRKINSENTGSGISAVRRVGRSFRKCVRAIRRPLQHLKPVTPALLSVNPCDVADKVCELWEIFLDEKEGVVKAEEKISRLALDLVLVVRCLMYDGSDRDQEDWIPQILQLFDEFELEFGRLQELEFKSKPGRFLREFFQTEAPRKIVKALEEIASRLEDIKSSISLTISGSFGPKLLPKSSNAKARNGRGKGGAKKKVI